jgi:hypothetical protein
MRNLVSAAIVVGLAWYGYTRYQATAQRAALPSVRGMEVERSSSFKCDGRTHCSQMTSCAEATYFTLHCPHTKMDGDSDGVACEQQWCR